MQTNTTIRKLNGIKPLIGIVLILSMFTMSSAFAAKPVYSGGKQRAAIRGYDPVAYFTENKPVEGNKEFLFKHNGAKWLFSSQENLETFKANPEKYTPQYGGYCAYAVSRGSTASIKPEFFTIHNDKLYLNYSKSVYNKWMKEKDGYIQKANVKWPEILEK